MARSFSFTILVAYVLTATLTHAQTLYTSGDTSGCNIPHILNGVPQPRIIQSSNRTRTYTIHTPSTYTPTTQYPLIIGYHGSSSIGLFFSADTHLSSPEYTANKIMVYPDGIGGAWAGANYSSTTVDEDLQFTWDMLADIRANYCIDSARIYATGISNGGGFVGTLACNGTVGGEFAALAPIAGAFYTDNRGPDDGCEPARSPMPIMEFHGGADADVFYNGGPGEGGTLPAIPDWLGWWAERNGCDSKYAQEDTFDGDVHRLIWTCRGQVGALQHYKVDDEKHDWPSTILDFSAIAAGDGPSHIEASAIIQEFFMNFTRPAE